MDNGEEAAPSAWAGPHILFREKNLLRRQGELVLGLAYSTHIVVSGQRLGRITATQPR